MTTRYVRVLEFPERENLTLNLTLNKAKFSTFNKINFKKMQILSFVY